MAKNGLHLITPTSIAYTGTSASISANGSVTFSACTSLSLNGVFSADYDNYLIMTQANNATGSNNLYFRYRASGSDDSSASYTRQRLRALGTSVTGDRSTSSTQAQFIEIYTTLRWGVSFYCYGPYLAQPTASRAVNVTTTSSAGIHDYAVTHSVSTSYDGITIYPDGGDNITGRIAVYGMRK